MSFFVSPKSADTERPTSTVNAPLRGIRPQPSYQRVGALLLRRIRYCGRFVYWAVKHRSTANVRWVLAFEGYSWN